MRNLMVNLPTLMMVASCAEPVIDATSEESIEASFAQIVKDQAKEDRLALIRAFSQIENAYMGHIAFRFEGENRKKREQRFVDSVAGLNAQQILIKAKYVEQAWALGRLLSARKMSDDFDKVSQTLDKIELSDIEFYRSTQQSYRRGGERLDIEATLFNGTALTFKAAAIESDLLYPDGKASQKYVLYFEIPEGIQPGETARLRAYSPIHMSEARAKSQNPLSNFKAITIYREVDDSRNYIIATRNFGGNPTPEGLKKIEDEYKSKYGDDEPAEWSSNIKRELAKHNMFRGY